MLPGVSVVPWLDRRLRPGPVLNRLGST